jgi:hypothetical protein
MALASVGHQKVGPVTAGEIFWASHSIGQQVLRGQEVIRRITSPKQNGPGKKKSQSASRGKDWLKVIGQ